MLVLTRHVHQSIVIGQDVVVTVLEVRGDQVRLGITAPKDIQVHREEVFAALNAANRENARPQPQLDLVEGHRADRGTDQAQGVDRAEIVEPAEGAPRGASVERFRGAGRVGGGDTARERAGRNGVEMEGAARESAARDIAGRASASGNGVAGAGAGGSGAGTARAGGVPRAEGAVGRSGPATHNPTGHTMASGSPAGENTAGRKDRDLATRTADLGDQSQPEQHRQPQQARQPEHEGTASLPPGTGGPVAARAFGRGARET
ncbi:MAG TPA: carbon storage regulator CsrA [Acidimicrobiales bacterium]|nr:carbon storage regulator CsrA [Acidimicrobiales bacterium]